MIPAAGIEDQELAITAKRPGVNNPTVARGSNLGARMGCDGQSLLSSTGAVRGAELADPRAVDRQTQMPAIRRECNRGREPAGILQGGQIRPRGVFFDGAGVDTGLPGLCVEALLELADEVLEIVDLVRQVRGMLPLRVEGLLDRGLLLLPLVDQHVQAQLLMREGGEAAR